MLENYVCKKNKVDDVGEIGYGKGYRDVSMTWQKLMVRLNQLPYKVIFISHIKEISEDGQTIERPSLEQKFYNMTMGRCDMSIKCRKVGSTYLQLCESKRDNYNEADVKDKAVLEILKNVKGVFPVATSPVKSGQSPVKPVPLKKVEATE